MSQPNVEVVKRLFERFSEGGLDAGLEALHEDLVIEIPPDMSAEPDSYHGHEGARRYFEGFDGMIEDVRFEAVEVRPVGELVLTHLRMSGRGVSSGLDVEQHAFVVSELVDGKVVRLRPYPDLASAEAAIAG